MIMFVMLLTLTWNEQAALFQVRPAYESREACWADGPTRIAEFRGVALAHGMPPDIKVEVEACVPDGDPA